MRGLVKVLLSILKDLRKCLVATYKIKKNRNTFRRSMECKKALEDIKELQITPLVLRMPTADQ